MANSAHEIVLVENKPPSDARSNGGFNFNYQIRIRYGKDLPFQLRYEIRGFPRKDRVAKMTVLRGETITNLCCIE